MISVSAQREDEEPWRIDRLNALLPRVEGLPILALRDHKGFLNVTWARRPSPSELRQVVDAWGEEYEPCSNHYVLTNGEREVIAEAMMAEDLEC